MTKRDDARRHWELIAAGVPLDAVPAGPLGKLGPSLEEWVRNVARAMVAADNLPDGNTRHLTIVDASGLTGHRTEAAEMPRQLAQALRETKWPQPPSPDAIRLLKRNTVVEGLTVVWALRALQSLVTQEPDQLRRTRPDEWIANRMGWEPQSPDVTRKRIRRQLGALRTEFDALLTDWPK